LCRSRKKMAKATARLVENGRERRGRCKKGEDGAETRE